MKPAYKKVVLITVGIAAIGGSVYASNAMLAPKKQNFEAATVAARDLTGTVSTTGTVIAAQDVSLSFERSGTITSIGARVGAQVKKGQTLVSLDSSDLHAQLAQAETAVETQQLKLQNLEHAAGGAAGADGSGVQVSISNGLQNLKDKVTDSYVRADSAMGTYVNQLFSNSQTNPNFGITISQGSTRYVIQGTVSEEQNLDAKKAEVDLLLSQWQSANAGATTESGILNADKIGKETLQKFQDFLADLATVINAYIPTDTNSQTVYSTYQNGIATARTSIDTSLSNINAAEQQYNNSQASASPYEIGLQKAAVASAEAQADAIRVEISKTALTSPIDGIITKQDGKVGQVAVPGTPLVSIISNGNFELETYVSEADIARIHVGDAAAVTLDAYGKGVAFDATVISVDPAETVTNGIGAYKVTLQFNAEDDRIKAGMAANIEIVTSKTAGSLAVPTTAIITRGTDKFVLVSAGTSTVYSEQKVETGVTSSDGYTEITSGLSAGEKVAAFGNK
jgi:HlyD family secretion protein